MGNLLISYLGGSTFLFGAAAVGQLSASVVVLFLLAALSTFAREVIKDVEDLAGDREEGLQTLPIMIGRRPALGLAVAVLTVAVAASPVPYLRETFGLIYLVLVAPAVAVMLYSGYRSFDDPAGGQSLLKGSSPPRSNRRRRSQRRDADARSLTPELYLVNPQEYPDEPENRRAFSDLGQQPDPCRKF